MKILSKELNNIISPVSAVVSGKTTGSTTFWTDMYNSLTNTLSPWEANSKSQPLWKAFSDSDFFRSEVPNLDDEQYTVDGYIPTPVDLPPTLGKLPYSNERALATTYRRGADRRKQVLVSEESATMKSYLLFPMKVAHAIGITRSNNLAIDSGRSQMPIKTMRDILTEIGPATEGGTAESLLLLDGDGETLGNIPLKDYIEGISVPGLGIGDTFATLDQIGMESLELTPALIDTLMLKISAYQSQLLSSLGKLREELLQAASNMEEKEIETNNLLEDTQILEGRIRDEPILVDDIQRFEETNPTLAKSDIATIAYILRKHADYFQVAVGENSVFTVKERLRATRDMFLETLQIAKMIKFKRENSGKKPTPNTCEHVAKLVTIRKLQEDTERFQVLTKFFAHYQGDRDENWINCNLCKKHLLCIHERLQIQAFINPKEKDTLQKEIILNFAGGQFQGKYICRNCGQAIQDIEFDTNMEYDDDGRPLMGRAVVVDKDAEAQEALDSRLGASVPIQNPHKYTDKELECYNIIREIAERVGIYMQKSGYDNIIPRVIGWLNKLPNRELYGRIKARQPGLPDYDNMYNNNIVASSAAFLLLEIQTRIPSYVVRYALQGCKEPGFDGFPLDTKSKQGLEYISCAVGSIIKNETPWNKTDFIVEKSDIKRQLMIMNLIEMIVRKVLSDDMIQQQIVDKQAYLRDVIGADASKGAPQDMIYPSFLPEQIIIKPSAAADNAIIPEVAQYMGNKGKQSLSRAWIRQSHQLATKTASLVKGSPLIETTCCISNITSPNSFWSSVSDLPQLDKRNLQPNQQGTFLQVHFNPRKQADIMIQADKELYFRLFLKCCFQGPRMGYSHEPGLTNKCHWCGFQFPTNPTIMDTDTEGKAALVTQEIKTETSEFTQLLDRIHEVNSVEPIKQKKISSMELVIDDFGNITPAPINTWREAITDTIQGFKNIPANADRGDVAQALGSLSETTADSERIITERFPSDFVKVMDMIVNLSWLNWYQTIQSYFITPFQRILNDFNVETLKISSELKVEISQLHADDFTKIIQTDTEIVKLKNEDFKKTFNDFAKAKIGYFISQLSALLPYKNKVRATIVPGRNYTLIYLQRAMLYGPIATLINPNVVPPGSTTESYHKSIMDNSIKIIYELLAATLVKFKRERLAFNDSELRERITVINEKEKMKIIKDLNDKTEEEKAVELVNKKLGIGRWAVGGTKLIYAYDPDYYDKEREMRAKAGIIDFPGITTTDEPNLGGRAVDNLGFYESGNDADFEQEGGYDATQDRSEEDDSQQQAPAKIRSSKNRFFC